ncbi:uncharacterized protein LOC127373650 isoform X2 [Dicentrarchus labrax]|uniref:uncharacterized protein LOC127373650 isoform X2 n=1 Tax=Dicentrarchus labrax TaxID=13489 RepID=UPI0021F51FA2|nr:uncharacterized protein LOC127373650 isoform X2 [Dicentrarchus labrax]
MSGGQHLLLLAAFVVLARCQQRPTVSISPNLKHIFSGDLLFLSCGDSGTSVKWYFNDNEVKTQTYKTWKIAVATSKNTGSYQCESNGQKSEIFSIEVLEYHPRASLTILTGQPVMQLHSSVILMLENDAGLQAWRCWVFRGTETKKIMLRLEKSSTNVVFQPRELTVSETIFWCTDKQEQLRSNQIIVRTSGKEVSLEMDPLPAVAGESLTLSCLVWGTDQITHTVFYKNGTILLPNAKFTHTISKVTESDQGSYKCKAIFTYVARTSGSPYQVVSDDQDVFVQEASMKADLSENIGMSCRCSHCPSDASYNWYRKKDDGQLWQFLENNNGLMMPKESGTYGCRAVFRNGMSFFSNSHVYKPPIATILVVVVIVLVVLGLAISAGAFYVWYKKRDTRGPIYEDVAMKLRGDDKYETLQKRTGGEYDTLNPEAPRTERKEGEYEPLKKGEMKAEVYHTLGMEGAAGGEGGYEALKKEGMKEGVYHTLGMEGAAGGEGGYEALKKEGMKAEVYHTLGPEGAGRGGEAVGKEKEYEVVKEQKLAEAEEQKTPL